MTDEEYAALVAKVYEHWDKKESVHDCGKCEPLWATLTWSERKEIRHNYEFEGLEDGKVAPQ